MPALTRSASATHLNKAYLTPHTPLSTQARALIDMTPLPSLFDKITEAANRRKRSNSLQLRSKLDDPFALPSIPEESERPSSSPVEAKSVQQASDEPIQVEDETEPEPKLVALQSPVASDYMDCEDTFVVFSEPVNHVPPPAPITLPLAPAPFLPFVYGEVVANFSLSNQPHTYQQHSEPYVTPPPTNQEPLLLTELTNSATFPPPITSYNPPSTSTNPSSYLLPQEQASFQLPQQGQSVEHGTAYPQYPMLLPPTYPTTPPILCASAPVQDTVQPVAFPVLSQSLPISTTNPRPNPKRRDTSAAYNPTALPMAYHWQTFVPQALRGPQFEDSLLLQDRPPTRLPRWRIQEIERQKEMDRIAAPYLARLQEVSRQKKVEAEARALAGQQKAARAKEEQAWSWWDFLRGDEKMKEVEPQQPSEKNQTRKNVRERRRRRQSDENTPPLGHEQEPSVSPRRKRLGRSKPYIIPHPATRSTRRAHAMPGGFDSDDLMSDHHTTGPSDVGRLWKDVRSVVDAGYRLWTQG